MYKTRQRHAITYRWRLCPYCKLRFRTSAEERVLEHLPVLSFGQGQITITKKRNTVERAQVTRRGHL